MTWSLARRCFVSSTAVLLGLGLATQALAQEKQLTLALARSAITPGEETFTYAVPKQMGWFKREGLSVNLIKTNGSTAALQAVASVSGFSCAMACGARPSSTAVAVTKRRRAIDQLMKQISW